ncbi:hypothetical protein ACHAQJ_002441 [Trichoderma viride]
MAPQNSERGQHNEFGAPWLQQPQLQLSLGDDFGTFSSWGTDPFADIFNGYHTATASAHRQYPPTATRYQQSNLAHLTSSDYVNSDAATHSSLHLLNGIKMPDLPHIQNSSDGHSIAPGSSSVITTAAAERHHDASLGIPPSLHAPTIPTTQRKSRARKPASEEWERHKGTIEHLYLKRKHSLMETITEMRTAHQFYATEKMYKDMFKQWKWSKNLPRDIAIGMLNKAKRRLPKPSNFQWGNQTWTGDQIKKTHGKLADQLDPDALADYPTPQGVTCETPRGIEVPDSSSAADKTRVQDSDHGPACRVGTCAPRNIDGPIDEGPFRLSMKQSSTADLLSIIKAASEADNDGNEEEAECGLRDALSCSSRLLSPTHAETVKIGYVLASFYARKGHLADAYDILNWMTNKHLKDHGGGLEADLVKIFEHMFYTISLLRRWGRRGEAELLTYHLLESQPNLERYPVIPQDFTGVETNSKEMIGELVASSGEGRLYIFLTILQGLAESSENHKFLQDIMPQFIERCDDFQQTQSNLAIRSRCILAEILLDCAQYERAKSILRGSGRFLMHQINSESLLKFPTLKLVRRVALAFLGADDPETCGKVIERVVSEFDKSFTTERNGLYHLVLIDFLISISFEIQKKYGWDRIRPWVERALSLCYSLFSQHDQRTKRIEKMLEAHKVEEVFFLDIARHGREYFDSSK